MARILSEQSKSSIRQVIHSEGVRRFGETHRYCGARSVQVMRRMRALVTDLSSRLPEERRTALLHWQERLQTTIARSFEDVEEKQEASVEDRQGLGVPRRQSAKI